MQSRSIREEAQKVRRIAVLTVFAAALAGYFVLRALTAPSSPISEPPNVVVILIDTLRPEYLGAYGHEPETAPFLAELAERSTVFTRAFSTSSWTAPSTASLFTSAYPAQHGVLMGLLAHQEHVEALKRGGEGGSGASPGQGARMACSPRYVLTELSGRFRRSLNCQISPDPPKHRFAMHRTTSDHNGILFMRDLY